MRLLLSARQHGWHPAAWRLSDGAVFSTSTLLDIALRAEQAAIDAVLFGLPAPTAAVPGDGLEASLHLDSLPAMGAAIGATQRVGLGGYWPFDIAEPFHVARVMATLDHLSGGRTAWITGLSEVDALRRHYGYLKLLADDDAGRRAGELVEVAVSLWDSWEDRGFVADQTSGMFADPEHVHPILHEGEFFAVRGPLNVPRPVQGWPVILHRDCGPGVLRRIIAPIADVVLAACPTIEAAGDLKAELAALCECRAPPRSDVPLLITSVMPVLARTEAEAVWRARDLDVMASCAAPRFVGTPDAFAAELSRWLEAGACDGFDLRPAVLPHDLDLICEDVLPALERLSLRRDGYSGATLRDHLGLQRPVSKYTTA